MPDQTLVSIVTPTLDRVDLLRHTIESVKRQTHANLEHIIVDGGSTDGTLELLTRYEGSYPMRWVSEPDDGMYQAINKGLRSASGDILAYLNSDDLYFPWTVDTVVEALRKLARSAANWPRSTICSVLALSPGSHRLIDQGQS